jgi:hypothetical protein
MANIREIAEKLAESNLESDPHIKRIYLFPSKKEIRLVEVDETAVPSGDDSVLRPFYFGASPSQGIEYKSAIALIRPEDERQIGLPPGWGDWSNAVLLRETA